MHKPNTSSLVLMDSDYKKIANRLNQYCISHGIKRRGIIYYKGVKVFSMSKHLEAQKRGEFSIHGANDLSTNPQGVQHGKQQEQNQKAESESV